MIEGAWSVPRVPSLNNERAAQSPMGSGRPRVPDCWTSGALLCNWGRMIGTMDRRLDEAA